MTTPSDDHAAREAEIRQRIAEEIREAMQEKMTDEGRTYQYRVGWRTGMKHALRIIERGGAQPEGEQQ